jgi:hypothetical protein
MKKLYRWSPVHNFYFKNQYYCCLYFVIGVTTAPTTVSTGIALFKIRVITKLPNSEQSYKGKVKTHKYINRQNQSTLLNTN